MNNVLNFSVDNATCSFANFDIPHAITTNLFGGVSKHDGDYVESLRILKLMRFNRAQLIHRIYPQHGNIILVNPRIKALINPCYCDGVIQYDWSRALTIGLLTTTADCPTLLLTDKNRSFIAAVHAGWRSLYGNIIKKTITAIISPENTSKKIDPEDILVALWEGICPYCYPVGEEFISFFPDHCRNGRISLKKKIIDDLKLARVPLENILTSGICNSHITSNGDFLFASHRRDKTLARNALIIVQS
jgi:copper oxidase (laccase) domain-containing protein